MSRARRRMKSTSATSSMTGSVLGMQTMVVTPPAAAAWLAVAKVSRCSCPGSPVEDEHVDQARAPAHGPSQSMISASPTLPASICGPRSAIMPSSMSTPPRWSRPVGRIESRALSEGGAARGHRRCPSRGVRQMARQRLEHRHADGDAHLDLLADEAPRVVGEAESISTPRFIGPGCMTMASGLAWASLSASRPKKWKYSRWHGTGSTSCARAGAAAS